MLQEIKKEKALNNMLQENQNKIWYFKIFPQYKPTGFISMLYL
jgi:hypothetical protein